MERERSWILDVMPIGVWVGRIPDGAAIYTNAAFREIMGMKPVPGVGIEAAPATYGIFDREGAPYPVERLPFSQVVASGEPVTIEDVVIHRDDGRRVYIRATGNPAFDADGQLTSVVVTFGDITREVEAERLRQETEARLQLAIHNAPIVIWAAEPDGTITLSEGAGLAALGVSSGDLVGSNVFELYRDHPTIPDNIRRALGGEAFRNHVEVGGIHFESWMTPLRDAAGEITGIAALSQDITEMRDLQDSAIQHDRVIALGTLAASVAHEINNPLTFMLGHAGQLDRAVAALEELGFGQQPLERGELVTLSSRMRRLLAPLRSGIKRIASITRELGTFSRDGGDQLIPVDLRSVVESVLRLVGKEVEARAQLEIDLEQTAMVLGDEARLVQVVLNLMVNAKQALPPDSTAADHEISISLHVEGDRAAIRVSDSGPGVPPELRERIFEPFVSTKEMGEGSGLGLFVCRNILRALGGEISVREREGGGALFEASLPLATPPVPPAPRPESGVGEAFTPGGVRVLVIDDEPDVLDSIRMRLESQGVTVVSELSGARALERLRAGEPFDLIFCDLMMDELSGMELGERLEAEGSPALADVVFMTGGAFTPAARAFLEANPDRCVEKPFDPIGELRRRLERD